jgi:hypothetical protein
VEFAYRGIPYLKRVLGCDGMANFMQVTGGIVVNWVNTHVQPTGTTHYWPISPSDKIRQVLELDSLDLDYLDPEMREYIAQTKNVTSTWTKGEPVTPHLHCELQLILYLEENFVNVVESVVGTSAPMCWACHCYIKKHNSRRNWTLSQTSGKSRDSWRLPPGRPDLGVAVLRSVDKKVARVVEEYAFGCYP